MLFGGLKSAKHTPGTTSPNLAAEAQKCYENCYAWSFCYDFARRIQYKKAKISDTETPNVLCTRSDDSVNKILRNFFPIKHDVLDGKKSFVNF